MAENVVGYIPVSISFGEILSSQTWSGDIWESIELFIKCLNDLIIEKMDLL